MNRLRENRAYALVFGLVLLAPSCGREAHPDTRADEIAIRELDAKWAKTAAANDLEGTVAFYADDATLLPPNAPIANTKAAIRASWAELLVPGVSLTWQVNKVDVAASGDFAYLIGSYTVTMKDAHGNPANDHGKLLEVWKKQADGKWKTVVDTYNSDLPLAPAAAPK